MLDDPLDQSKHKTQLMEEVEELLCYDITFSLLCVSQSPVSTDL
jgi:hypothetical protein